MTVFFFPSKLFCPVCTFWVRRLCQLVLPSLPAGPELRGLRSQSSQIPAFIRNYASEIAYFVTLLVVCILSTPLKANLIKTTTFMAFLGESINILNYRAQKIGQKSCTQNKSFEQRRRDTQIIARSRWKPMIINYHRKNLPRTQTSLSMCAQRKAGRSRLYPSHGPLRFITSHSFRARLCHAKNKAPEEEAEKKSCSSWSCVQPWYNWENQV